MKHLAFAIALIFISSMSFAHIDPDKDITAAKQTNCLQHIIDLSHVYTKLDKSKIFVEEMLSGMPYHPVSEDERRAMEMDLLAEKIMDKVPALSSSVNFQSMDQQEQSELIDIALKELISIDHSLTASNRNYLKAIIYQKYHGETALLTYEPAFVQKSVQKVLNKNDLAKHPVVVDAYYITLYVKPLGIFEDLFTDNTLKRKERLEKTLEGFSLALRDLTRIKDFQKLRNHFEYVATSNQAYSTEDHPKLLTAYGEYYLELAKRNIFSYEYALFYFNRYSEKLTSGILHKKEISDEILSILETYKNKLDPKSQIPQESQEISDQEQALNELVDYIQKNATYSQDFSKEHIRVFYNTALNKIVTDFIFEEAAIQALKGFIKGFFQHSPNNSIGAIDLAFQLGAEIVQWRKAERIDESTYQELIDLIKNQTILTRNNSSEKSSLTANIILSESWPMETRQNIKQVNSEILRKWNEGNVDFYLVKLEKFMVANVDTEQYPTNFFNLANQLQFFKGNEYVSLSKQLIDSYFSRVQNSYHKRELRIFANFIGTIQSKFSKEEITLAQYEEMILSLTSTAKTRMLTYKTTANEVPLRELIEKANKALEAKQQINDPDEL